MLCNDFLIQLIDFAIVCSSLFILVMLFDNQIKNLFVYLLLVLGGIDLKYDILGLVFKLIEKIKDVHHKRLYSIFFINVFFFELDVLCQNCDKVKTDFSFFFVDVNFHRNIRVLYSFGLELPWRGRSIFAFDVMQHIIDDDIPQVLLVVEGKMKHRHRRNLMRFQGTQTLALLFFHRNRRLEYNEQNSHSQ